MARARWATLELLDLFVTCARTAHPRSAAPRTGSRQGTAPTQPQAARGSTTLSPRPPALLALNEPEGSLHPSLYLPLAELIADASADCQIWITTHSQELADHLLDLTGYAPIELYKQDGQTLIKGAKLSLEDELD